MRNTSNSILPIGPLLICRDYIQYPAAFGGPCVSTSTNTHTHIYDSIKVISKGDVVLDSWGDHVFHFGQVVPYISCHHLHESWNRVIHRRNRQRVPYMWWTVRFCCYCQTSRSAFAHRVLDRYTASAQLVPKRHRPIVSASPAYPTRAPAHNIGGWLACWLAKHSWPSCRSFVYRIWTFRHDLGGRRCS
jgi:hypothetical protein